MKSITYKNQGRTPEAEVPFLSAENLCKSLIPRATTSRVLADGSRGSQASNLFYHQ